MLWSAAAYWLSFKSPILCISSSSAQAKKIKLEEEIAELQKELADDQSDYAVDAQKEALDDMQTVPPLVEAAISASMLLSAET